MSVMVLGMSVSQMMLAEGLAAGRLDFFHCGARTIPPETVTLPAAPALAVMVSPESLALS